MYIELSLFPILNLLTFSAAFMLGFLFFTMRSANKKANVFLGLFLWFVALSIFMDFMEYRINEGNGADQILYFVSLFVAPLLYMYMYQTINKPYIKMLSYVFLPLFVVYALLLFFVGLEDMFWIVDGIQFLMEITLYVLILKKLYGLQSELNDFYSELENKRLSWIKAIVYISLMFMVFDIVELVFDIQEESEVYLNAVSAILSFIMVYWVAYNGFSQSEIFQASLFRENIDTQSMGSVEENAVVSEVAQKDKKIFDTIKRTIENEKIYANPELNLRTLSEALQIKEKELSRLINSCTETNFYHFINGFRVQEFKRLVKTDKAQQLSILGLAQEAGFSSRSTFYNTFKTMEGMTPKQYGLSLKKET